MGSLPEIFARALLAGQGDSISAGFAGDRIARERFLRQQIVQQRLIMDLIALRI